MVKDRASGLILSEQNAEENSFPLCKLSFVIPIQYLQSELITVLAFNLKSLKETMSTSSQTWRTVTR